MRFLRLVFAVLICACQAPRVDPADARAEDFATLDRFVRESYAWLDAKATD